MSLVSGAALLAAPRTALVVLGGLPLNPLSLQEASSPELRPSCAHTSRVENHLVLDSLYPTIPSPFARFIINRSLVSCSSWIFRWRACTQPIDKTTKHHHLPPVAHFAQTTRKNLDAIPTRTAPYDFLPAGIGLALFVCCSNSFIIYRIWYDPPGRQLTGFPDCPLFMCAYASAVSVAHHNRDPSIILLIRFDFFRPCHPLFASGSTFKFVL